MAQVDLTALRDEIVNDPQGVGYKSSATADDWKGDQEIVDLINALSGPGAEMIRRSLVTNSEIRESVDLTEWAAMSAANREWVQMHLSDDAPIDITQDPVFDGLTTVFPQGSATRAVLLPKIQRQGSRSEVLWGEATQVTAGNVGRAFNLIGS